MWLQPTFPPSNKVTINPTAEFVDLVDVLVTDDGNFEVRGIEFNNNALVLDCVITDNVAVENVIFDKPKTFEFTITPPSGNLTRERADWKVE
jgi:hypothetical protein